MVSMSRRQRHLTSWAGAVATGLIAWAVVPATHSAAAGTIEVQTEYDGQGRTIPGIGGGAGEGGRAVFEVQDGGVVKNVTIGATTDGIHCRGSCTLENIHWLSVGDDAVTAYGGPGTVMTVRNSSVDVAEDKAFQHNGGGTVVLEGITAGTVGHLYASCGNCGSALPRSVVASGVTVGTAKYDAFAIQDGDKAPQLSGVTVRQGWTCTYYNGNASNGRTCGSTPSAGGSAPSVDGSAPSAGARSGGWPWTARDSGAGWGSWAW